jgi:tetratricopeptide (TPR) repeat protein
MNIPVYYRLFALIAFVFLSNKLSFSQEECDYTPSEKVAKLLEQSEDKKKYDNDKRKQFLEQALEQDENCLPCLHKMGVTAFKSSKHSGASFSEAESLLERLVEKCPDYHSDPYYYLGAMKYATGQYADAKKYFDKYIHFPDDDQSKFYKDYDKNYEEVMGALPSVNFYEEFYGQSFEFKPRIVNGVSGKGDEYLPALSPDNELMFYTRKYEKKAKGDIVARWVEEFTMSRRTDINATFDGGEPLPAPFNLGDNYGGATISLNNKEMFITKKVPKGVNPENFDLFVTRFRKEYDQKEAREIYKWSELEDLGTNINTDDGWEAQPSLSADGNMLFFATVRPACIATSEGSPSTDIFVSDRGKDGKWGPARSIGNVINTAGHEKAPFMHSDSKTLYFASTGHMGGGGYDIFYAKMNDDGSWTTPKNIGSPINTEQDEHGLIVSTDGALAYYATRGLSGTLGFDVASFELPEKAKPEKVMLVKGEVKGEDGEPVKDAKVEIKYAQSKEITEIEIDDDDGKYAAVVNVSKGEDVILNVSGENVAFNSRIISRKEETEAPAVVKLTMKVEEIEANKPFIINDILYTTNSADFDEASGLILNEFAEYLKNHPSLIKVTLKVKEWKVEE